MEISEIRKRLSIETVLSHLGLQADSRGNMCCPLHDDKKASMKVYFDSNTVRCFSGNCEHGSKVIDQIDLLMLVLKISKREAIMLAKSLIGHVPAIKKAKPVAQPTTQLTLDEVLTQSFVNGFNRTKKAQEYALKRGLNPLELELGYSSGQLHYHKPESYVKDLEALGLLIPLKNGHQSFGKNCLIFPLKNEQGSITGMYSRRIDKPGHYYLKNRSGLYPGYPARETEKLILAESVIDAASLLQIKELQNYSILALYGTNGLTSEHKQALKALPKLKEITIMLDGDEAGRKAAATIKAELQAFLSSTEIRIVDLPENTDVNELWVNHQSAELFKDLLEAGAESPTRSASSEECKTSRTGSLNVVNSTYLIWETDQLKIEVLGGMDLTVLDSLRVTLRISRKPKRTALDVLRESLDLYHSQKLGSLLKKLHEQLELPMQELRMQLAELIEGLEEHRQLQRQKTEGKQLNKRVLSKEQKARAKAYLTDLDLMENTWRDLGKVGVVGEQINAFVMFLCFSSRKMKSPLHVISLGSSGSGKTHLQETIARLIPEEEVVNVTSLSDNALYYFDDLRHKLFLLEDMDGMSEDGMYGLREIKSKGFLAKRIPLKDSKGKLKTVQVQVLGPICFAGCTTKERVYEDNANRCLLLHRDESKAHKKAVMAEQRKAAAGKVNELEQLQIRELFKDCQMLLKPLRVVNPYAEQLDLPDKVFKPLRTNAHYLKFIEVVTWYHQLQREVKTSRSGEKYIETTLEDVEWANKLLKDVLLAKSDELSWGVRRFLERLKDWLKEQDKSSFEAKEIRRKFRLSPSTQIKYLSDLRRYGLIKVLSGNRYRGFEYGLTEFDDYQDLVNNIDSAFDQILNKIGNQVTI